MHDVKFMVLTGHLDDYPLPSLIKTLFGQRKSGRLQIEYEQSPGAFYFERGKLVDARLGELRGLEALLLALSLPGASFNFNPLVKPPDRTFPEREQNFIRDLLEAPTAPALNASAVSNETNSSLQIVYADENSSATLEQTSMTLSAAAEAHLISEIKAVLAENSRKFSRERAVYAAIIAIMLLVGGASRFLSRSTTSSMKSADPLTSATDNSKTPLSDQLSAAKPTPVLALAAQTAPIQPAETPTAPIRSQRQVRKSKTDSSLPAREGGNEIPTSPASKATSNGQQETVSVVMQVTAGRVVQAKIQNSRPGMATYEALALRMARQRRYPEDFTGQDTLFLKVKP